jgi:hypothetical protein
MTFCVCISAGLVWSTSGLSLPTNAMHDAGAEHLTHMSTVPLARRSRGRGRGVERRKALEASLSQHILWRACNPDSSSARGSARRTGQRTDRDTCGTTSSDT